MSLIIKNSIGNPLLGAPTVSDKYDVITGIVGDKAVYAGQIVEYDGTFQKGGRPFVKAATSTSKFVGVITHQNVHTECENQDPQVFKPGEVVGICIKGFITVKAKKGATTDEGVKIKDEVIDNEGDIEIANIVPTGYKTDKKDFEVWEVIVK